MIRIRILSFTILVVALGVGYYLFDSVYENVRIRREIRKIEAAVIERLIDVRKAQRAYQSVYGRYASDWDRLISFVRKGNLFITSRREQIITLEYGADSIQVLIDTLGVVSVRDSIFNASVYPDFDPMQLPIVPHNQEARFDLYTGEIERAGVLVQVVEVSDPAPINPKRSKDQKARNAQPLHFGSRTTVSLAGNWE